MKAIRFFNSISPKNSEMSYFIIFIRIKYNKITYKMLLMDIKISNKHKYKRNNKQN